MSDVDPLQAAAEAQLDRLDRMSERDELDDLEDLDAEARANRDDAGEAARTDQALDEDEYGIHVDDPDTDLLDDDLDSGLRDDVEADALDVIAEVFNARDLEGLVEVMAPDGEVPGLLGYERDNLPDAVEDLWTRRPTVVLTRGRAEVEHVGVLWEHDGTEWWPVAVVHVDDVRDGRVGVLEFSDDAALLERVEADPPDDELDEGARWAEWDEGSESG